MDEVNASIAELQRALHATISEWGMEKQQSGLDDQVLVNVGMTSIGMVYASIMMALYAPSGMSPEKAVQVRCELQASMVEWHNKEAERLKAIEA